MNPTDKVKKSVKAFIEKMKAADAAIPEELAQDALEMAEEIKDACEEIVNEKETKDQGLEGMETLDEEKLEAKIEDALTKVLLKHGAIKDSAMRALDELEVEKEKVDDECVVEDETEEVVKAQDSLNKLIKDMRPIIASVKDSEIRKKLSDSLASFVKSGKTADYASILNATKKNANDAMSKSVNDSDIDYGMNIAKKFNPHYKEG
jgi:hypothetical protein